jgi:hypothetical protein
VNEDTFNMQVRKFLKKVGITSQREIDNAVRDGLSKGALSGNEILKASVVLHIPELDLKVDISDTIALE